MKLFNKNSNFKKSTKYLVLVILILTLLSGVFVYLNMNRFFYHNENYLKTKIYFENESNVDDLQKTEIKELILNNDKIKTQVQNSDQINISKKDMPKNCEECLDYFLIVSFKNNSQGTPISYRYFSLNSNKFDTICTIAVTEEKCEKI